MYHAAPPWLGAIKFESTSAHKATCMQLFGGLAVLLRSIVLQQLLAQKRSGSKPLGLGQASPLQSRGMQSVNSIPELLSRGLDVLNLATPGGVVRHAISPLLSPLKVQRALQVYPKLFVSPRGELRGPAQVMHILRGASALAAEPRPADQSASARAAAAVSVGRRSTADAYSAQAARAAASQKLDSSSGRRAENIVNAKAAKAARSPSALDTIDLYNLDGQAHSKPLPQQGAQRPRPLTPASELQPALADVAMTSIDKSGLAAGDLQASFLSSALFHHLHAGCSRKRGSA
jgi:hypothetical protein